MKHLRREGPCPKRAGSTFKSRMPRKHSRGNNFAQFVSGTGAARRTSAETTAPRAALGQPLPTAPDATYGAHWAATGAGRRSAAAQVRGARVWDRARVLAVLSAAVRPDRARAYAVATACAFLLAWTMSSLMRSNEGGVARSAHARLASGHRSQSSQQGFCPEGAAHVAKALERARGKAHDGGATRQQSHTASRARTRVTCRRSPRPARRLRRPCWHRRRIRRGGCRASSG